MAYTPTMSKTQFIPVEPAVISCYCPNSAAETNIPVSVPWDDCMLTYAICTVVTVIDGAGAMEMRLNKDNSSGTQIGTASVTAAAAVGTQFEFTMQNDASRKNLGRSNNINIKIDGSATGTGAVMVWLYFERTLV